MHRFVSAFAALVVLNGFALSAFTLPDRVPFTIRDDFETGELRAWESYPYTQDTGYDPRTFCQREPAHNGSGFAAARIVKPNDILPLTEGFTKEIDLWTLPGTRLKAAVFITADRKPETLEFSLGLFNGERYFHTVNAPAANRWLEFDIPLDAFTMRGKPVPAGAHVQVVTITAHHPVVSPLMSYTISLDDFSLNGERQRRFTGVDPASTDFELFGESVFNRHFFFGDVIALTVKPEDAPGKGPLTAVTADVVDSRGETVASGVKFRQKDGAWTAEKLYTIRKTDPRGYWRVAFCGRDAGGADIRWDIRFIMPGDRIAAGSHPRLHFSAEELKRRLTTQSPAEAKLLENALKNPAFLRGFSLNVDSIAEGTNFSTESLTGHGYSVVGGFDSWLAPITQLSNIVRTGAWLYAINGDEAAGQKARTALLKMCSFRHWNNPWHDAHGFWTYYPMGYFVGPAAFGYDLLYPLLSESERKTVRDAFLEKAIKPFHRDMVEMNQMPSNLTNHIAVVVSNFAVAATAIYGDDPENPSVEPYLSGILAKMKRYMDRTYYPDGSYGESLTYQDMATRDIVESIEILDRNFGIDYTAETNLKDSWLYPLSVTYANGKYPDFGDVDLVFGLNGLSFQYFTHRLRNPYLYDFTRTVFDSGRGTIQSWLRYTTGITPKSRAELPPSHYFPVKGHLVMRSDWSDTGTVGLFKCGPNSNHYHCDQGTFQIMANGEALLSDAGHSSSYYANLYYPCYYIQSAGHNVMLVDGAAESQEPADFRNGIAALQNWPRISHAFAGQTTDEVEGDLTCVYRGNLERYTRSLLSVKPGMIFLRDSVKGAGEHTYSWLFHAEHTDGKSSISAGENSFDITRTKSSLHMDILSPAIASSRIRNSDRDESFIVLSGARGTKDADFLAVMFPRPSKDAPAITPASTLLNPPGWIGARVDDGGTVTIALFRNGAPEGTVTVGGFVTDAERFSAVTGKDGNLASFFVRGSSFGKTDTPVFRSGTPLAVSGTYGPDNMEIETETESAADIAVRVRALPETVTINGAPVKKFQYSRETGLLTVTVPAGHTRIMARYEQSRH